MSKSENTCNICGEPFAKIKEEQPICLDCFLSLIKDSCDPKECKSCGERFIPLSENTEVCPNCLHNIIEVVKERLENEEIEDLDTEMAIKDALDIAMEWMKGDSKFNSA